MSWSSSWWLWWLFSSIGSKSDVRVHERAVCLCTPLIKSRSIIHGDSRCSDWMPHPCYVYWEKCTHKVHLNFQRSIKHLCMITRRTINIFTWMHLSVWFKCAVLVNNKHKVSINLNTRSFSFQEAPPHASFDLESFWHDLFLFTFAFYVTHFLKDILALMLCFP